MFAIQDRLRAHPGRVRHRLKVGFRVPLSTDQFLITSLFNFVKNRNYTQNLRLHFKVKTNVITIGFLRFFSVTKEHARIMLLNAGGSSSYTMSFRISRVTVDYFHREKLLMFSKYSLYFKLHNLQYEYFHH